MAEDPAAQPDSAASSVSWTVNTASAPVISNTRATTGCIAGQMDPATGGLGLQPGAEQHVEPGGVTELQREQSMTSRADPFARQPSSGSRNRSAVW